MDSSWGTPGRPVKDLDREIRWTTWTAALAVGIACLVAPAASGLPDLVRGLLHRAPLLAEVPGWIFAGCAGALGAWLVVRRETLRRTRDRLVSEEHEMERLGTRLSELSGLFDVSASVNLKLRIDGILNVIVRRVVEALDADQCSIMLVEPGEELLECRAAWGEGTERIRKARVKVGEAISGWVAEHGKPLLLNDDDVGNGSEKFRGHFHPDRKISSALCIPFRLRNRSIGVLNVNRIAPRPAFQDRHRRILSLFAEHVASVIDRAGVYERVDDRAIALEGTNQGLASAERMKERLVTTVSKELRTPLTCIQSYVEFLAQREPPLPAEAREEFLKLLSTQTSYMLRLVDEMLDLSRLDQGTLEVRKGACSADAILDEVVRGLSPVAQRKQIRLEWIRPVASAFLRGDAARIRQVFRHLVANAIKFTDAGGTVRVSLDEERGMSRIRIQDSGIGIAPGDREQIFEPFVGLEAPETEGRRGLGLGLHLARRLVELHEGSIQVESEPGRGSTFTVLLPLVRARRFEVEPLDVGRDRSAA